MYRQPSKQKVLMQRIVVYSLMTVSVIGLVIVLVYVMLGYQYNSDDGRIEQGGLVQFDSRPSGADITIDGAPFSTRTAAKTTMSSGQHHITMDRDGYVQWKKSIIVDPGAVLWLNYARLVPKEREQQSVVDLGAVTSAGVSPDSKNMATVDSACGIKLSDLSRDDARTTSLSVPKGQLTVSDDPAAQNCEIAAWDPSSRYVLLRHTFADKHEWIVVDTDDVPRTKNITTLLGVQATKVRFSNHDSQILYGLVDHAVRKINIRDATLSRPLVNNVDTFDLYSDNMVTYATRVDDSTQKRSVGYYIDGADAARTVRTTSNTDGRLRFVVGRYFGDTFQAIAIGDSVEVLKGDLPRDTNAKLSLTPVTTFTVAGGAEYLSDHTDGRFIVAQNAGTYVTYDLELSKVTTTALQGASEVSRQLRWMDGYHVWSDRDGMLRMYEFDGANQQDLMPVAPHMAVSLSPDGRYLYGINKQGNSFRLVRIQMIL